MEENRPRVKHEPQPIILPERCGWFQPSHRVENHRTTLLEPHSQLQPSRIAGKHRALSVTMPGATVPCHCGSLPDPYDLFCGQCGKRLLPRLGVPSWLSERG
jgi:hypothetical protein